MRYIILIISFFTYSIYAKSLIDYHTSIEYQFDSNIGQNITEEPGGYVIPNIGLSFYPIKKAPMYFTADLVFDCYVKERDFDDNSPLINGGIGIKLSTKKLKYLTNFSLKQFVGMNAYSPMDSISSSKDWISVLRIYSLKNNFGRKLNNNRINIKTKISLIDYGDIVTDSGRIKNEEDAYNLNISPSYQYNFKFKSKAPFKFKNVTLKFNYEGNFAQCEEEKYNRFTATIGTNFKLLITIFSLDAAYSQKRYTTQRIHPNSNKLIDIKTNYFIIKPNLTIPIISDLFIEIGGKLRFRNSNYPTYDYDRHTAYSRILWNSSIKRKNKKDEISN